MRGTWNEGRSNKGDRPLGTLAIVGALVASFVVAFLVSRANPALMQDLLAYDPTLARPWTLLTYPFYRDFNSVIWFAIGCWIIYQFLSGIELYLRTVGTIVFFLTVTFLAGLFFYVGSKFFGPSLINPSLNLPVEYVVFAWCLLNRNAQIMLMMVIPCPTKVLMWLCVAAVVIEYGWTSPFVGAATAMPLLLVWLYVTNRIPFMRFGEVPDLTSKRQQKREKTEFTQFIDDVKKREREREEKERLRRLFEDSLSDEDKKDG